MKITYLMLYAIVFLFSWYLFLFDKDFFIIIKPYTGHIEEYKYILFDNYNNAKDVVVNVNNGFNFLAIVSIFLILGAKTNSILRKIILTLLGILAIISIINVFYIPNTHCYIFCFKEELVALFTHLTFFSLASILAILLNSNMAIKSVLTSIVVFFILTIILNTGLQTYKSKRLVQLENEALLNYRNKHNVLIPNYIPKNLKAFAKKSEILNYIESPVIYRIDYGISSEELNISISPIKRFTTYPDIKPTMHTINNKQVLIYQADYIPNTPSNQSIVDIVWNESGMEYEVSYRVMYLKNEAESLAVRQEAIRVVESMK